MRARDGVEITGEMQVDVFHRHDLRITAASRTTLDAEARPKRRLAQADRCLLADVIETIAKSDRRCRLAFARRRRVDRGDEDQLAILAALKRFDELSRNLSFVMPVGQQMLGRNAKLRADVLDVLLLRLACDFNIGFDRHGTFPIFICALPRPISVT